MKENFKFCFLNTDIKLLINNPKTNEKEILKKIEEMYLNSNYIQLRFIF